MESSIGVKLSEDKWFAYNTLSFVFPHLDVIDILRCSEVCKLWQQVAMESTLWRYVAIENCKLNFNKMTEILGDLNTVHLKLTDCKFILTKNNVFNGMKKMQALRILELSDCSSKLIETLPEENPDLKVIRANIICGLSGLKMDVSFIARMQNLCELKLYCNRELENMDQLLANLGNLKHLYLLGVKHLDLGNFNTSKLSENSKLESLALGDCPRIPNEFVNVLKSLTALRKLRLENCIDWNPVPILLGISELKSIICLELLEVCVPNGFESGLKLCKNIEELTIVPTTNRFNMAHYNTRILVGARFLKGNLKKFTWGFSERYMQYFRKILNIEDGVPILKNYSSAPECCFIKLNILEHSMNNSMEGTVVTITKSVHTGNVFM